MNGFSLIVILMTTASIECSIIELSSDESRFKTMVSIISNNRFRVIVMIKTPDADQTLLQNITRFTNNNLMRSLVMNVNEVKTFNGKYHEKFSYEAIYEESRLYAIFAGNMKNFSQVLDAVVKIHFWRNRHRTMVSFRDGSFEEMEELFRLCWRKRIVNIVFLWFDKVYTYNPFLEVYDLVLNTSKVFADKYMNMNGMILKMSMFETALDAISIGKGNFIGRDAFLSQTLALSLNSNYTYLPPRDGITYGMKYPNGSMSGVFADVANFYGDITMNSRLVKLQFENILEHTYPHDREDIACLVPKSAKQAEYKKFTILFPELIWILLGASVLAFTVLWYFATDYKNREFLQTFFHVVSITLGIPILDQTGFKRRAVLIFYTFYMFLLLAAYHGVLTSVLTVPITLPEINTLSDLENSGLEIIAATRFKDMLQDNKGGSLTTKLIDKITRVPDDPDVDKVIKKRGHYAVILKETFALRAVLERDNYQNGKPIYRVMKEKPMPSQVCYAMRFGVGLPSLLFFQRFCFRYGSPALPRINKLLRRYQENGLNVFWKDWTVHLMTLMTRYKEMLSDDESLKVLTLDNVSASYYILGLGFAGSFLVFMFEHFVHVIYKHRKRKKRVEREKKQKKTVK